MDTWYKDLRDLQFRRQCGTALRLTIDINSVKAYRIKQFRNSPRHIVMMKGKIIKYDYLALKLTMFKSSYFINDILKALMNNRDDVPGYILRQSIFDTQ